MTKYLAIAFLITGFLAGDAYGGKFLEDGVTKDGVTIYKSEDGVRHKWYEVYYCTEEANVGFNYNEVTQSYDRVYFKVSKFKIKIDITDHIEIIDKDLLISPILACQNYKFDPEVLTCGDYGLELLDRFIFNTKNGRFTFFRGHGYVSGDGDSIHASYGTCDKF